MRCCQDDAHWTGWPVKRDVGIGSEPSEILAQAAIKRLNFFKGSSKGRQQSPENFARLFERVTFRRSHP